MTVGTSGTATSGTQIEDSFYQTTSQLNFDLVVYDNNAIIFGQDKPLTIGEVRRRDNIIKRDVRRCIGG